MNANPVEKESVLKWYHILSEAFTNIGLYPKAPPPAPPSSKDVDSPSPPQTHPPLPSFSSHRPCSSTAYFGCWRYSSDMTIKRLCMNLHFFHGLVSAMNIILGHYNLYCSIYCEMLWWETITWDLLAHDRQSVAPWPDWGEFLETAVACKIDHQDLRLWQALVDRTLPCQGQFTASENMKWLPHAAALIKKLCMGLIDGHPGTCKVSDPTWSDMPTHSPLLSLLAWVVYIPLAHWTFFLKKLLTMRPLWNPLLQVYSPYHINNHFLFSYRTQFTINPLNSQDLSDWSIYGPLHKL